MKKKTKKKQIAAKPSAEMMIFERNMAALQRRYPEIVTKLQAVESSAAYEIVGTESGVPTLVVTATGQPLYDPVNPMADAIQQLTDLKLKNVRIGIMLGLGLGYELNHYVRELSLDFRTEYLVVMEKDPILFIAALRVSDLTGVINHNDIYLMLDEDLDSLYSLLFKLISRRHLFIKAKAMSPIYNLNVFRLHKDYYLKVLRVFNEALTTAILNYGNCPHDSLIGLENVLDNLEVIAGSPGIKLLYNRFKGKPAIVIATGPSLNKNKHLLKGLEDKALMIAADASLKILLDMGVKPHLVTSLERIPDTIDLFRDMKAEDVAGVHLAACPVIPNEAYQVYPGPRVIVYRDFDHFRWIGIDKGILEIKLSAGNMAFKMAHALGCDPIILVGQDLALARDGRTNAAGNVFGEYHNNYLNERRIMVPANDGEPIATTDSLYSFLKAYEVDMSEYPGLCINATEGGAYIQGTKVMGLQEAIDTHVQQIIYPLDTMAAAFADFSVKDQSKELSHLDVLLTESIQDVKKIIGYCRDGIAIHEVNREKIMNWLKQPATIAEHHDELMALEEIFLAPRKRAMALSRTYQQLLQHIIQSFSIKFETDIMELPGKYDTFDEALAHMLLMYVEWYAVIGDLSQICLNRLEKAKEKISSVELAVG